MSGTTWVYVFLGIYIIYCFYWGLKGILLKKPLRVYTIAGRSIPFIAFLMAATAASFSGWTFIGHPGLIWRDGLAYAFASFYVLTHPHHRYIFLQANLAFGETLRFYHAGRHVRLLFQHGSRALADRADGLPLFHVLFGRSVDGLCRVV